MKASSCPLEASSPKAEQEAVAGEGMTPLPAFASLPPRSCSPKCLRSPCHSPLSPQSWRGRGQCSRGVPSHDSPRCCTGGGLPASLWGRFEQAARQPAPEGAKTPLGSPRSPTGGLFLPAAQTAPSKGLPFASSGEARNKPAASRGLRAKRFPHPLLLRPAAHRLLLVSMATG